MQDSVKYMHLKKDQKFSNTLLNTSLVFNVKIKKKSIFLPNKKLNLK